MITFWKLTGVYNVRLSITFCEIFSQGSLKNETVLTI